MHFRESAHHHVVGVVLFFFCAWISASLIVRLWLKERNDPWPKKLFWSLILCIPLGGWLVYGAFYKSLPENDVKASLNTDAFYGG